jgi:iron-sulfur cluster repair protein YtfE (RIC family)
MSMSAASPVITADLTVNQVALLAPATLPVFVRYGVDACCGGAKPVAVVAARHGLDLDALLADLVAAAGGRY